ncbi:ornithine carbamoyltransferase [Caballeronia udeis]
MVRTKRDFLALNDVDRPTLRRLLERSQELAGFWKERRMPQSLTGKCIGLVVNDTGWRNTTAFDLGIQSMGGLCVHAPLRWDTREDLEDLAAYLDNWFDGIVTRAPDLAVLRRLADLSRGPVINARTRHNHPCETLGDLAFYFHRHGTIDGIKVAVVSPESNILGSWIEAAAALPITVVQVYPERWHAPASPADTPRFYTSTDLNEISDADILVTDCWPEEANPEELSRYQITTDLLEQRRPGAEFLPCPPVSRGKEVSAGAMKHVSCRVVEAKAFLLHAQNAVLEQMFAAV